MDEMGRGLFPQEALTPEELQKQKEFKEEILPHLDLLYNFALRLTTDPADAEDLVQDTIVKAFRFFSSFEKGTNALGKQRQWADRVRSYREGAAHTVPVLPAGDTLLEPFWPQAQRGK